MITKDTAKDIYNVCREIEEGKRALELLTAEKPVNSIVLNIMVDEDEKDDESYSLFVFRGTARAAVEKHLEALQAEYERLETHVKSEIGNEQQG